MEATEKIVSTKDLNWLSEKGTMNEKLKVITASEEWTLFTNKQPVESQNGKRTDGRLRRTTMMPRRDRDPSTWRTGLIAPSNK